MSLRYLPLTSSLQVFRHPIARRVSVFTLNVLVNSSLFNLCRLSTSWQESISRISILKYCLIVYPLVFRWISQLYFNHQQLTVLPFLVTIWGYFKVDLFTTNTSLSLLSIFVALLSLCPFNTQYLI